jgi:hypothetical protein
VYALPWRGAAMIECRPILNLLTHTVLIIG